MAGKQRLDILLTLRGLASSRSQAQSMIMAGEVRVDDAVVDKPGAKVPTNAQITVKSKPRFVSRGGEKLAAALADFDLDVTGRVCADVGASTGGFTDCLLRNGVARVYAVDVGYGQLDYRVRQDKRVIVLERTNARYLEKLAEPVNLVVIDVSFISLKMLLSVLRGWLMPQADLVALVKPQFEAGKKEVGKGGVVRDPAVHARVLADITDFARAQEFEVAGLTRSPIQGPAGNVEFLLWLAWGGHAHNQLDIAARIDELVSP